MDCANLFFSWFVGFVELAEKGVEGDGVLEDADVFVVFQSFGGDEGVVDGCTFGQACGQEVLPGHHLFRIIYQ